MIGSRWPRVGQTGSTVPGPRFRPGDGPSARRSASEEPDYAALQERAGVEDRRRLGGIDSGIGVKRSGDSGGCTPPTRGKVIGREG